MTQQSERGNLLKMIQEKLTEKEEIIAEQQQQINDLEEKLRNAGGESSDDSDTDEVIRVQMEQIIELQEQNEALQQQLADTDDKMKELDELQNQLKTLLGE